MSRLLTFSVLGIISLLAVGNTWQTPEADVRFAEKVNLALRRTAHHLLVAAGDSTSRIPPVQEPEPRTFTIRIDRSLDYNRLPNLLQESLKRHDIRQKYDVSLLDCGRNQLQLGYSSLDLLSGKPVPCVDRYHQPGCYVLKISFEPAGSPVRSAGLWWGLAGVFLLGVGVYSLRNRSGGQVNKEKTAPAGEAKKSVQFGQSSFDATTQTLYVGAQAHTLTYREAKLLGFFLDHPNQVVGREAILKAVWEDEGVTVGRSVDVFVSRLRKLMQHDSSLQIKAVHGVGYRFEVAAS
ncbi:winged helix-turn-helix domain-containing protein [Tellurirhabdus rosea]|uniref:winged helix-turn-helix domain-containing protein n=1 Tax=Tellurirhabdus rosea TaxID=2674997 RepID=UPI0022567B43|nr:winged helix-turn-helix domain-containing protein [Tellurirhabdus rosea]